MPGGHSSGRSGRYRLAPPVRPGLGDSHLSGTIRSPAFPCVTTTCSLTEPERGGLKARSSRRLRSVYAGFWMRTAENTPSTHSGE